MTDFNKILDKAKELQVKMKESQEKIKKSEVFGESGGGSVKVGLNGNGDITSLELSKETWEEDKNIIIDLIIAAHAAAKSQLKMKTNEEITKATGGFGVPGFKWPL